MNLNKMAEAVMWLQSDVVLEDDPLAVLFPTFGAVVAGAKAVASSSPVNIPAAVPAAPVVVEPAAQKTLWNRMGLTDLLAINSDVAKYNANLAAIDLLLELEQSGRVPSEEDRLVLNRYTGWGGLPCAFNPAQSNQDWSERSVTLQQKLSAKEHAAAEASTLNAHYTPPEVVRAVWEMVQKLGFEGGDIIEPAAGTGYFLAGMPESVAANSKIMAVEPDMLSARILRQLYQSHGVKVLEQGFEAIKVPAGVFDLAISNVPFGNYGVSEQRNVPFCNFLIHDYFFARALEVVRPGGLVVFITSTGTMDKHGDQVRAYLSGQANLVAAVRLPNGVFKQVAGTEVGADILVFQKHASSKVAHQQEWVKASYTNKYGGYVTLNAYWEQHPEMVIGKLMTAQGRYGNELRCMATGDLETGLARVTDLLPAGIYQPSAKKVVKPQSRNREVIHFDSQKRTGYFVQSGKVFLSDGAKAVEVDASGKLKERIERLCEVRDAARKLLQAQLQSDEDGVLVPYRLALTIAYDKLVKTCGPISNSANRRAFRDDPDLPLVLSLEHWDEETQTATKAEIFEKRTIRAYRKVEACSSVSEAYTVSLCEVGDVDPQRIAELVGMSESDAMAKLEEEGLVFLDPETDSWVPAFLYLSGNVRIKHTQAVYAGERFLRNVKALEAVIPKDLTPQEIGARVGANWIPSSDYAAFLNELCNVDNCEVQYSSSAGAWSIHYPYSAANSVNAKQVYGTSRINALELFELAMNQRVPEIKDKDQDKDRYVLNRLETIAAREKQSELKEHFQKWLWSDLDRANRLVQLYNNRFNSIVAAQYDGSHLKLPGYSYALQPRQHQLDAVWRGVASGKNVLLGHVVGAGKTLTMIMMGMELRRMGKASRPLFVCPNHMLLQFAAEFVRAYPMAKLLMATKDDLSGDRRKLLMSRIATEDWDAVLVTHASFERIAMTPEYMESFIQAEIDQLEMAIRSVKGDKGNSIVKELARAKKQWQVKLEKLDGQNKKDDVLYFEDLGIDYLAVDESHLFKSLFRFSKMNRVAGLSSSNSQRAFDMFVKTRYIMEKRGSDSGVCFATGTFVSNTMAEMWVTMKYLQPTTLSEMQINMFDDWAGNFGEVVTALELSPDGRGYRVNSRFAKFVNLPELMNVFGEIADIRTAEMLQLPVPKAVRETVVVKPTTQLKSYVDNLVKRAERIRAGGVSPDVDNMLKVAGDGRNAALDMRLVGLDIEVGGDRKIQECVSKVVKHWNDSHANLGTQVVFCDTGTPGGSAMLNVYQAVKDSLMEKGIPEKEIAFIHDFDSDAAKETLFQSVRAGQVRVLLGSTSKMGTGVNIQQRLIALHHLDAPWRPADVEQREGRICRQGNSNDQVFIYRYVTEASFDSYVWQTLETKQRFIVQVMQGDRGLRSAEDIALMSMSYAEVKALASGNPLVLEKAGIDAELAKLSLLKTQWEQSQWRNRNAVASLPGRIEARRKLIEGIRADIRRRQASGVFKLPDGTPIANRSELGKFVLAQAAGRGRGDVVSVGTYRGMSVFVVGGATVDDRLLSVRGSAEYTIALPRAFEDVQPRLDLACDSMEAELARIEQSIIRLQLELDETEALLQQTFDKEERLLWLAQRQKEIEDELDLSKGENAVGEDDGSQDDIDLQAA